MEIEHVVSCETICDCCGKVLEKTEAPPYRKLLYPHKKILYMPHFELEVWNDISDVDENPIERKDICADCISKEIQNYIDNFKDSKKEYVLKISHMEY